ncbi:DUF3558 domain-containing protein [Nocardia asteroides NBRC 15531]|uniref:DUF3558 domain-containing protein n=1 Tax=Nocardia asteroides NBRC 15531 TaxID=1110697 RepID=U5E453_NOCAS|nr:DUF3558 domain-containing protein [Nocardia asteroides]TLF69615.1 DUF3558 domain-containing protein [Nocardia asteroides NBRC 15531]UGT49116.1 DUF3558 domain-containing protein [Nocardia asteroides]GAD83682.1 hypothetical protein NCAST_20_02510 [Nocardia asteroides NBRC 15531]
MSRRIAPALVTAAMGGLVACGVTESTSVKSNDVPLTFDPCTDLVSGFVEQYSMRTPGRPTMEYNNIPGCEYKRTVAEHSKVFVALYNPSEVSANEAGLPPTRKVAISGYPAEISGWREAPAQAGKYLCSTKVELNELRLMVYYSDGLLPLPDEDYSCRRATEMSDDLIEMVMGQK